MPVLGWTPGTLTPIAEFFLPPSLSPLLPLLGSFFCAPFSGISLWVSGYYLSLVLLLPFHVFFCFFPNWSFFLLRGLDWSVVLGPCFPLSTLPEVACLFSGFGLSPPCQQLPKLSPGSPKHPTSCVLPQAPYLSCFTSSSQVLELCCGGVAISVVLPGVR